jgi:hypothetical protein
LVLFLRFSVFQIPTIVSVSVCEITVVSVRFSVN